MMDMLKFIAFAVVCFGLCIVLTPNSFANDRVISSTAIVQAGAEFHLMGYIPRNDIPKTEGKEWLESVASGQNGFIPEQCIKTSDRKYFCQRIEMRQNGQDIGHLGVISGVTQENRI